MTESSLPPDETERLAALRKSGVLSADPDERFDRVVRLARMVCETPVALINLVDSETLWFKAASGTELRQAPRAGSFCDRTVLQDGIFTVPDAAADDRFAATLCARGSRVRFYAGHPLRSLKGMVLGTLCVMDTQPRVLSPTQEQGLRDLAALAENELNLASAEKAREEAGHALRQLQLQEVSRQRAVEELNRAKEMADAANHAKSELMANVGHEIRTPMNGLLGMAELLARTELHPQQREYLETMRTCGESLLVILNDVLDFSKVESGKLILEHAAFDILETVQTTVELLALMAEKKGISVVATVAPDVPLWVMGDATRLRQVLTNLIGNAIKFTLEGSVTIRVERLNGSPGVLRFEVKDTGIGIAPEAHATLFDPYVQAEPSTTRRFGGTGLGLSICKRLVNLMEGKIGVESAPDRGSLFWFEVPLPMAEDAPGSAVSPVRRSAGMRGALPEPLKAPYRKLSVLVADDNALNQRVALGMLNILGHTCSVACDGIQAVEAVEMNSYDIVLMDCEMPRMDGRDAATAIRKLEAERPERRRIPIIALTAYLAEDTLGTCLEHGMDGYLRKPLQIQELQSMLEEFTGRGTQFGPEAERKSDASTEAAQREEYTAVPVLDSSTLDELRSIEIPGEPSALRHLLNLFFNDAPPLVEELKRAIDSEEAKAVRGCAHKLAGSCLNFGGMQAAFLCRKLEKSAEQDDLATARDLKPLLEESFQALCAVLKREFDPVIHP